MNAERLRIIGVIDGMTDHQWSMRSALFRDGEMYPDGLSEGSARILKFMARIAPTKWVIEGVRQLEGIETQARFRLTLRKLTLDKPS